MHERQDQTFCIIWNYFVMFGGVYTLVNSYNHNIVML